VFPAAVVNLQWLVRENPQLHPNIYDDGQNIYQGLIDEADDEAVRLRWEKEKAKLSRLQEKLLTRPDR